jgi:regulator of protease activity HflC (stomatin/prohibitin superfamily)
MVVYCCCIPCLPIVSQSEVGVVERLGKFHSFREAGMSFICCPLDIIKGSMSTRVRQMDVKVESKTKDNVFVYAMVSVQYMVKLDALYDAFYKLTDPEIQIRAYVFDVLRSTLPRMELDQAFEAKEEIAHAVKSELERAMADYGFAILQTLVTDLEPDKRVKDSMNEINAAKRLREAATDRAEADKIMMVKAAEAEAESKYLSGVGVSRQRKAIVDGLRDSIADFSSTIEGTTPKDVMSLLMLTQYFDTMRDIGANAKSSAIFVPHTPDAVAGLEGAVRNGLMQSSVVAEGMARP